MHGETTLNSSNTHLGELTLLNYFLTSVTIICIFPFLISVGSILALHSHGISLFICGLFNDADSSLYYTASNNGTTLDNKRRGMRKHVVVA